jgi:hypothetical protein
MRTFNGRVIFVDEVALDKLDGQTTLSDTTATDYHELIFPEELQKFIVSRGLGLLGASVARSHRAQSHWRRPAVGGGACILSTPLRRRRMCSKRREVEASGRFASHGRLKGRSVCDGRMRRRGKGCDLQGVCSAGTTVRREGEREMESRRGGRIGQRESVEQVYVVACGWVCERLAGGVDGVCRDAVWCEEQWWWSDY